jgi:hypothetical protein
MFVINIIKIIKFGILRNSQLSSCYFFGFCRRPPRVGHLKEISRWLAERGSAEMASPQAMAQSSGHDRAPTLAGGHGHNEAWRATPPAKKMNASRRDARDPWYDLRCALLASLRDAVFPQTNIRWCRSPSLAQPPAKFWQTSSLLQQLLKPPACFSSFSSLRFASAASQASGLLQQLLKPPACFSATIQNSERY